jgi:hypothetical protein
VKRAVSAHDVFWLARYAHNTLDPLFKAARQYDPTIHFILNLNFAADHPVYKADSLGIYGHWAGDGMFIYRPRMSTTAEVQAVAAWVQEFIDAEQAKLEALEDLRAEHETRHAGWLAA